MSELLLLLFGHCVADFALQSPEMAKGKNRNRVDMSLVPPGQTYTPTWFYWLSGHAGTHAFFVYVATGSVTLAACEFVAHWVIDFGKCENWYGPHVDQGLHIACKFLWAGALLL